MSPKHRSLAILTLLFACSGETVYIHDRVACATETDSGSSGSSTGADGSTGTTDAGGSSSESDSSGGDSSSGAPTEPPIPVPTGRCPAIVDGTVSFCPDGFPCRDVRIVGAATATGAGPLMLHWHGTYENPDLLLSSDWAAQAIQSAAEAEGGIMALPYADPDAPARPDTPFPWWVVGDPTDPQLETDRLDDFALADEVAGCLVDGGLVDGYRLGVSGMSAGGIMTSHLVDRRAYFAAAVSWSGGLPADYQPTVPPGPTAVMAVHGGPTDLYCGAGVPGGGCYDFVPPTEALAADVVAGGAWAFLCDHQAGHSAAMGAQGAEFLALADWGAHPWTGYDMGSGAPIPASGGTAWMLNNYCYDVGEPSPWE